MQRLTVYMGTSLLYALHEAGSRINAELLLPSRIAWEERRCRAYCRLRSRGAGPENVNRGE